MNYLEKKKIDVHCLKVDKKEFLKDKIILKTQQGFKTKRHNLFTEVITKIAFSSNNDKRMQSVNWIEIYAYGTTKDLTCKKKKQMFNFERKKKKRKKQMFNFDLTLKEYNPNWPKITDHPCPILIIGGSGPVKTNALLNLINHEPDINKMYLYAKDPNEPKYQLLINRRKSTAFKYFNDSKAFIKYSNDMNDIYKNIEYKKRKILIVFDNIITDILSYQKLNPIITELFIRERKLNIPLVFVTQSYFVVPEKNQAKFTTVFCYENSELKIT